MAQNALTQAISALRSLAGKAGTFARENPTPVSFVSKQATPTISKLSGMVQSVGSSFTPPRPVVQASSPALSSLRSFVARMPSFIQQNPLPAGYAVKQFQAATKPIVLGMRDFTIPFEKQSAALSPTIKGAFPVTQVPSFVGENVRQAGRYLSLQPTKLDLATAPFMFMGFAKTKGIQQALRDRVSLSKTPEEAATIYSAFADKVMKTGGKTDLQALRAVLNKELTTLVGGSGSYKKDYAIIQNLKNDTQVGGIIRTIENKIATIDDVLSQAPKVVEKLSFRPNPTTQVASRLSASHGLGQELARKGMTWDEIIKLTPAEGQEILQGRATVDDFMRQTPVQQKIHPLDKWRTPENVLRKIGLGDEAKVLRSHWEAYQDALPREIGKIRSWMQRVPSKESNERIFRALDGENVGLIGEESKVYFEIKQYLADWASKLKIPPFKRVRDYISHIYDLGSVNAEFDEDLAKLIDPKIAKSVYDPFLLKRTGQRLDYLRDTWQALTAYTKRATRKYNLDPALERLAQKEPQLELSQWKYVKELTDRVNMRPTDFDTELDNFIKSSPIGYKFGQRPTALLSRNIRQATYRGTLGLNVSSALRNLTQGANTYAELGEKWTIKGYLDAFRKWGGDEPFRVGVLRDSFIQDKTLSAYKKAIELVDKGLFAPFEIAEKTNRIAAYYGAKARALSQGMSEQQAIEAAKALVRKTHFTFGSIDTPLALQSDAMKVVAQLQSFTVKQIEYLLGKVSNKEWAGLLRYIGATLAMKELLGRIGISLNPVPTFGLSPTLQAGFATGQIVFGDEEKRKEGMKNLQRTAVTVFPAGVQLRKTIEGLQTYGRGESTAPSGVMRFPIEQTTPNLIKSGLFGQYSTPEAREYFDTDTRPLSEKQSEQVRQSDDPIGTYQQILKERQLNAVKDALKDIQKAVAKGELSQTEATQKVNELYKMAEEITQDNAPKAQTVVPPPKASAVSTLKALAIKPLTTYRSGGQSKVRIKSPPLKLYSGTSKKLKFKPISMKAPKVRWLKLKSLSRSLKLPKLPVARRIKVRSIANAIKKLNALQQAKRGNFTLHAA